MSSFLTEYERERQERIERNNRVLKQLAVGPVKVPASPSRARPSGTSAGAKRKPAEPRAGSRSSARLATLRSRQGEAATPSSAGDGDFDLDFDEDGEPKPERVDAGRKKGSAVDAALLVPDAPKRRSASAAAAPDQQPQPDPASVRGTSAVPAEALEPWVGKQVLSGTNPPKASAIALLTRGSPDAAPPKFSKYSGVAELLDAVAVFVNLDKGSGDIYDNNFSEGGRRMSWFASSRMHEETPAILRMLQSLPADADGDAPGAAQPEEDGHAQGGAGEHHPRGEPVYLFLREPGCYYTFCGRVSASAWVPGSRPLRLEWLLTRFDDLLSSQSFRGLLGPVLEEKAGDAQ